MAPCMHAHSCHETATSPIGEVEEGMLIFPMEKEGKEGGVGSIRSVSETGLPTEHAQEN